jgi:structure-specific endonuclease subunit SLX1
MNITKNMSFVYLLVSTCGSTYVGSTIDLDRRLRQHNAEIKGGAKRTTMKVSQGEEWTRVCYISGFPSWKCALQFEWRWKQLTRKINEKCKPLYKRIKALNTLLSLDRSTSKAIPYQEWENPPQIYIKNSEFMNEIFEFIQLKDQILVTI